MKYQDPRPLSSFNPKEREILKEFQKSEAGTDCTFTQLPERAQKIALDYMAKCSCKNELVRWLDTCKEFRREIGCMDGDVYPREVDVVARFYDYRLKRNIDPSCMGEE